MNNLLFVCLLLISSHSYAQLRPGTGGHVDLQNIPTLPENEGESQGVLAATSEGKILYLTNSLVRQDKECRSEGHRFLDLKNGDFMQAYLKLSILKSTFVADDKCQDLNTYLKCLYSPAVKSNVQRFLSDKKMNQYLQKRYDIKNKEAQEVIQFFKTLDRACGKNGCKM